MPGNDNWLPLFSELSKNVNQVTVSQADAIRYLDSVDRAVSVALDKLNELEKMAVSMSEKTRELNATHYSDTTSAKRKAEEIMTMCVDLRQELSSVQKHLQTLPDDIKSSVRTVLESTCPIKLQTIKSAFEDVIASDKFKTGLRDAMDGPANWISKIVNQLISPKVFPWIVLLIIFIIFMGVTQISWSTSGISIERDKQANEKHEIQNIDKHKSKDN